MSSSIIRLSRDIKKIQEELNLSDDEIADVANMHIEELNSFKEGKPISTEGLAKLIEFSTLWGDPRIVLKDSSTNKLVTQRVSRPDTALEKLERQIVDLRLNINQIQHQVSPDPKLQQQLDSLQKQVLGALETSRKISAPVLLPSEEDLAVQLVSSTSLERLDEYRSDASNWSSISSIFIGAVIGIIINVITGGELNSTGWGLGVMCVIMAIITGYAAYQASKRGKHIKDRMFGRSIVNKAQNINQANDIIV